MRIGFSALIFLAFVAGSTLNLVGQTTLLDNATFFSTSFEVNDAIYDPTRDVVFATTPSSQGPAFGNLLLEINPANGNVNNATFVGSEPNQLAISADGSQIYLGIDGAQGVRTFSPNTGALGAIVPLANQFGPAVAEDIAVSPGFPDSVVVSRNTVGSSAGGSLEVFTRNGTTLTSTFSQGFGQDDLISFVSTSSLFGFNISSTGFNGTLYDFDGQTLTLDTTQSNLISQFNTEVETGRDGQIYFTNGLVLDGSDLSAEGTFNNGLEDLFTVVEPVPELGITYFAGPASFQTSAVTLNVFDNDTFLQLDSIPLPGISTSDTRGELIAAGPNRLALLTRVGGSNFDDPRVLTFISNIPVAVPEPNSLAILAIVSTMGLLRRRKLT